MVACIEQSSSIPAFLPRVVFRRCRIGSDKSDVVSRTEVEALNHLYSEGDYGETRAFHAKLFTLRQTDVGDVEAVLKEAKAWAEDPVVDTQLLFILPNDRRYGYASTKQEDGADDPAIVATNANWMEWQDIVRRYTVTVTGRRRTATYRFHRYSYPCR